jgi:hypothetical protein
MSFSNKHQNERVFATENVTIILATPLKNYGVKLMTIFGKFISGSSLSPVMKKMVSLLTAVY